MVASRVACDLNSTVLIFLRTLLRTPVTDARCQRQTPPAHFCSSASCKSSHQDEDRFRPRCRSRRLGRCLRPGLVLLFRRPLPELRRQRLGAQHGHGAYLHHGASCPDYWNTLFFGMFGRETIAMSRGGGTGGSTERRCYEMLH